MRSSCEASARNRRRRSSLACWRSERALEPVEHRVERETQPADLGARVDRLDAVREVAAGDRARGVADPVERQQPDAHDRPADEAERQQHAADHEQLEHEQPLSVASTSVSGAATTVTPAPNRSGSAYTR